MKDNKKTRPSAATLERAEDELAFCETTPSTAHCNIPAPGGQLHIADYLSRGREHATTRRELERAGFDDAQLRLDEEGRWMACRKRRAAAPTTYSRGSRQSWAADANPS